MYTFDFFLVFFYFLCIAGVAKPCSLFLHCFKLSFSIENEDTDSSCIPFLRAHNFLSFGGFILNLLSFLSRFIFEKVLSDYGNEVYTGKFLPHFESSG